MQSCFDYSRCARVKDGFKFYVYPDNEAFLDTVSIHKHVGVLFALFFQVPRSQVYQDVLTALRSDPRYTSNPAEACVLIPSLDTSCDAECANLQRYRGDLGASMLSTYVIQQCRCLLMS